MTAPLPDPAAASARQRQPPAGDPPRILATAAQLGLLAWVVHQFQLESPAFVRLLVLTLAGFLIHSALAPRLRLPFFALLSLAGLVLVLGWTGAALLLGIGLALIALCHLPVPWRWRYAALLIAGGLLAWLRWPGTGPRELSSIWPILASMFMFRLIIYTYDLRHSRLAPSLPWTLSYFFLLPNVCFPLFPVVDYRTLRKSYYTAPATRIYQRGIRWMSLGVCQLLLYRLVYQHLAPDPAAIATAPDLILYVLSAYLLILRVIGQFQLVVGMLLLFGFDLPPVFDRMFLAAGFSDFWRRANIYWKEFMAKLVFYPSFLRWRRSAAGRRHPRATLGLAAFLVFLATWLLHSYQWYWLTGRLLLAWNDALFWFVMGVLVMLNVLHEDRRSRQRSHPPPLPAAARRFVRACRVAATFLSIALLFSMWTSDSLGQWLDLWSMLPGTGVAFLAALAVLWTVPLLIERIGDRRPGDRVPATAHTATRRRGARSSFWPETAVTTAGLVALLALAAPALSDRLGSKPALVARSLRTAQLNPRDMRLREQGYYETLLAVSVRNRQLRRIYQMVPPDWQALPQHPAFRPRADLPSGELVPGSYVFKRARLTVNSSGMRDQEYSRAKPEGVVRIALLDGSDAMGSGVDDGETFEAIFERRLNAASGGRGFEVLNFAVGGFSPIEDVLLLETKVLLFEPDLILLVVHSVDPEQLVRTLRRAVMGRIDIPDPGLRSYVESAAVSSRDGPLVVERRLMAYRWELLDWAFERLARQVDEQGLAAVVALVPRAVGDSSERCEAILAAAAARGLNTLDLTGAFDGQRFEELRLVPWDDHPSALGHRLIANQLLAKLGPERLRELVAQGRRTLD